MSFFNWQTCCLPDNVTPERTPPPTPAGTPGPTLPPTTRDPNATVPPIGKNLILLLGLSWTF